MVSVSFDIKASFGFVLFISRLGEFYYLSGVIHAKAGIQKE